MAKKTQGAEEIQGEQVELKESIGEGVQIDGQGLEPLATIPDDDAEMDLEDAPVPSPKLVQMHLDHDSDADGPAGPHVNPEQVAKYVAAGRLVTLG